MAEQISSRRTLTLAEGLSKGGLYRVRYPLNWRLVPEERGEQTPTSRVGSGPWGKRREDGRHMPGLCIRGWVSLAAAASAAASVLW